MKRFLIALTLTLAAPLTACGDTAPVERTCTVYTKDTAPDSRDTKLGTPDCGVLLIADTVQSDGILYRNARYKLTTEGNRVVGIVDRLGTAVGH